MASVDGLMVHCSKRFLVVDAVQKCHRCWLAGIVGQVEKAAGGSMEVEE